MIKQMPQANVEKICLCDILWWFGPLPVDLWWDLSCLKMAPWRIFSTVLFPSCSCYHPCHPNTHLISSYIVDDTSIFGWTNLQMPKFAVCTLWFLACILYVDGIKSLAVGCPFLFVSMKTVWARYIPHVFVLKAMLLADHTRWSIN